MSNLSHKWKSLSVGFFSLNSKTVIPSTCKVLVIHVFVALLGYGKYRLRQDKCNQGLKILLVVIW